MGKATRLKQQSAREKIAAQRAAEKRAERRRMMLLTGGSTFGVIAVVLVFILIYTLNQPSGSAGPASGTALPASVVSDIKNVPASTFGAVGGGLAFPGQIHAVAGQQPLTSGGKPEMLYIGAEYCPYCAAMRWSMAVALSRFGEFTTPLKGITSSATDVYAKTSTLTFYRTGYSSRYLVFTPVEAENGAQKPLQTPTAAQTALWDKVDSSPGSFPFIDIGNKYWLGVIYNPGILGSSATAGVGGSKSWAQIAAALKDPSSPIARGVVGTANYLTAAICKTTNNQPASVCTSPAITALQGKL
ncbi:MAG TPA: DUF929 family protein [Streptosporangiaceae bacterium]|nr:DUF929 family protein [Streptosporangiaceae bacterium]